MTNGPSYVTWRRGDNIAFPQAPNFTTKELTCKCSVCLNQRISVTLLEKLQALRDEFGEPITITSAFRCTRHQQQLKAGGLQTAVGTSTHETGDAVDVSVPSHSMPKLLRLAEKHFKAIGTANTFLHLDTRPDKVRRWKYS